MFLTAFILLALMVPSVRAPGPPVSVTVTPGSQASPQGSQVTYTVNLAGAQNPSGQYALSLSGLNSGQYSFSPNPLTVSGGSGVSTLTVSTNNLPGLYCPGSYPFTVTAQYTGPPAIPDSGTSSTTFLTVAQVGPPLLISVNTDKPTYMIGDKVTILVIVNRPAEGSVQILPPGATPQTLGFNTISPQTLSKTLTATNYVGRWTVLVQADDYCNGGTSATAYFDVTPNTYSVSISLSGVSPSATINLQVDGQSAGSMLGSDVKSLEFKINTQHTVTVDQYVSEDTGVRFYCAQNTWSVSSTGSYTFAYEQQFLLTVGADPNGITQVGGGNWYKDGSIVQIGQIPQIVNGTAGTRYELLGFTLDGTLQTGNSLAVTMGAAHTVIAKYQTEYLLVVDSPYGSPKGQGYYAEGSTATFSVTSPWGFPIQQVFQKWEGDYTGSSPQGSVNMDATKVVHAVWSTSYIPLIALVAVALAVVAGVLFWKRRKGSRPETKPTPKAAAGEEIAKSVKCASCGTNNPSGQKFCTNCGNDLAQGKKHQT
jgi:zinc-ribbon domain